mmetsp:Transcript_6838/g.21408  ORF Transcript_6838/g.21408 Transcript_6838/m.21408 type:complete len:318 (-) Transcript_6838:915-1868(-)
MRCLYSSSLAWPYVAFQPSASPFNFSAFSFAASAWARSASAFSRSAEPPPSSAAPAASPAPFASAAAFCARAASSWASFCAVAAASSSLSSAAAAAAPRPASSLPAPSVKSACTFRSCCASLNPPIASMSSLPRSMPGITATGVGRAHAPSAPKFRENVGTLDAGAGAGASMMTGGSSGSASGTTASGTTGFATCDQPASSLTGGAALPFDNGGKLCSRDFDGALSCSKRAITLRASSDGRPAAWRSSNVIVSNKISSSIWAFSSKAACAPQPHASSNNGAKAPGGSSVPLTLSGCDCGGDTLLSRRGRCSGIGVTL